MATAKPDDILDFWQQAGPAAWFRKDLEFDKQIISKFTETHKSAASRQLDDWRGEAETCLALILVLDQFSRNMFRGNPKTFAQDAYALELAKFAVENEFHLKEALGLSGFFYLPFMHSEVLADQEKCVDLIRQHGEKESLNAAIEHRDIIAKFGRFPHRNQVLGRQTTQPEQKFLDEGGFAG